MKSKTIMLSLIFVLCNTRSILYAAQQTKLKQAAAILAFAKNNPAAIENRIDSTNELIRQLLETQLYQKQSTQKLIIPDELEEAIHTLNTAIEQAEKIRDSYSYFNPYRYVLSNKIASLKKLQEEVKNTSNQKKWQKDAQKTVDSLASWLK